MKTIKRTIIKIRQRELIVGGRMVENEPDTNDVCPLCRLPITSREILFEETKPAALAAVQNETETK